MGDFLEDKIIAGEAAVRAENLEFLEQVGSAILTHAHCAHMPIA